MLKHVTPCCATVRCMKLIVALLKHNNKTGVHVNAFDKYGTTALVVAPRERQTSLRETAASALWAAGAKVDARDPSNGCTVRTHRVVAFNGTNHHRHWRTRPGGVTQRSSPSCCPCTPMLRWQTTKGRRR